MLANDSNQIEVTPLAGFVEYTDDISAEGKDAPPHNNYQGYHTKQSEGEAPVMFNL